MIIVTDDQRAGTLTVMPRTRWWFERSGTRFSHAFVTTPLCCPSRATIFTGRYAHNHGVETNGEGGDLDQGSTLQRYLHDVGYRTGLIGKFLNAWPLSENPAFFDSWAVFEAGYYDSPFNVDGMQETAPGYTTTFLAGRAVDFLEKAEANDDQPWLLFVTPYAPHLPAVPEPRYQDASVGRWARNPAVFEEDLSDKPPVVRNTPRIALSTIAANRREQLRTQLSVDDLVGRLFRTLGALGEQQDTLAFFTSDNGFLWGEHGLAGRPYNRKNPPAVSGKRFPYTPSVQVPLLARWPGRFAAGATDPRLVANIDLAPTALAAAGVQPDWAVPVDGRSLLDPAARDRLLLEYFNDRAYPKIPSWASTRTADYQYVEWYGTDESVVFREYYDQGADPWQLENRLRNGDHSDDPRVLPLSDRLASDRACVGTSGPKACP